MRTIINLYPAIFLYMLFFILKINGQDWATDLPGLHAGIGAMFLLFGASVCHLTFIIQNQSKIKAEGDLPKSFWVAATFGFLLMFMDSTFGIHERYSAKMGIPEQTFLLFYGSIFLIAVTVNLRKLSVSFIALFVSFGLVSVAAIFGDMSANHEGLVYIAGTAYSFEQFLETLGCLLVACAFATAAIRTLALKPAPVSAKFTEFKDNKNLAQLHIMESPTSPFEPVGIMVKS